MGVGAGGRRSWRRPVPSMAPTTAPREAQAVEERPRRTPLREAQQQVHGPMVYFRPTMKGFLRALAWLLGVVLLLALLGGAGVYLWPQGLPAPRLRGRISLEGPCRPGGGGAGPATGWCASGPRRLEDLLFAQGFVHAQERLWQMEFQRRVGQGRLCARCWGELPFPRTASSAPGAFTGRPGAPTPGSTPRRGEAVDAYAGRGERLLAKRSLLAPGVPPPGLPPRALDGPRRPGLGQDDELTTSRATGRRSFCATGSWPGGEPRAAFRAPSPLPRGRPHHPAGRRTSGFPSRGRRRPRRPSGDGPAPLPGGQQQLGGGGKPHHHRQAPPGRRPPPGPAGPEPLVPHGPRGPGA